MNLLSRFLRDGRTTDAPSICMIGDNYDNHVNIQEFMHPDDYTYPTGDWDEISLLRRINTDFEGEPCFNQDKSTYGQVKSNLSKPAREQGSVLRAGQNKTLRPNRATWLEVKAPQVRPNGEKKGGFAPRLTDHLTNLGLQILDVFQEPFLECTVGQAHRIHVQIANKSYLPFQVKRGQRLGWL